MKSEVKISVIMGVFNPVKKKLFYRAVKSIIKQNFKYWELIIYDDGSKEEYIKRIQQAAQLDERIIYIRNDQNHGLAYALNECINHASGNYIARMDDDDISKPDRLRKQYEFLETHPQYQWVGSNAELIDSQGVWGYQKMPEIPHEKDFLFNSPFIHPSVMFRKDILIQNDGYRCCKNYLYCEDYELFIRLYKNGGRGYNIQEPLLQYWEDYESHRKRTYKRRIREMKLRYHGFKELNILNRSTFYYVVKPLLVGAVPAPVHHYIRRKLKRQKKYKHNAYRENL